MLILQKKKECMNIYGHISYMMVYVYEYLCMFLHIYTYSCMKNFLPEIIFLRNLSYYI